MEGVFGRKAVEDARSETADVWWGAHRATERCDQDGWVGQDRPDQERGVDGDQDGVLRGRTTDFCFKPGIESQAPVVGVAQPVATVNQVIDGFWVKVC